MSEGVRIEVSARSDKARRIVIAHYDGGEYRDSIDTDKASDRKRFLTEVGRLTGKGPAIVPQLDMLIVSQADQADAKADAMRDALANGASSEDLLKETSSYIRQQARSTLEAADMTQQIDKDLESVGITGESNLKLALYLVGTSRVLDRPASAIVQGPSSSGKSYVVERTAELFPPEVLIQAHQQTPQSLYHLRPGSLAHKFVVAGERSRKEGSEGEEATRALREMISSGKLLKLMPVKIGGKIVTEQIEQQGPIAYVESTTATQIFDEDANRCLLLHTDESQDQTRRIVQSLGKVYSGHRVGADAQQVCERHHAIQRMLQPWNVVIPYAVMLGELIETHRVETRRAFPLLLAMIQASCLLHQFQRQFDREQRLMAVPDDYAIARRLIAASIARVLGGGVSAGARRFFCRINGSVSGNFTAPEIARSLSASDHAVRNWLKELHPAGFVALVEEHKGQRPAIWQINPSAPNIDDEGNHLPTVEEVFGANE